MKQDNTDTTSTNTLVVERLLGNVDKRPELPVHLETQWRNHFAAELNQTTASHKRHNRVIGSIAACIALCVLSVLLLSSQQTKPQLPLANISHKIGAIKLDGQLLDKQKLLFEEQVLRTDNSSFASLNFNGHNVRINNDTEITLYQNRVFINKGSVYIDTVKQTQQAPLLIDTNFGNVSHLGTQFIVRVDKQGLYAAVREGAISINTGNKQDSIYKANEQYAKLIHVDHTGVVSDSSIPKHTGIWTWVNEIHSPYPAQNGNLDSYLQWAARELGYNVVYKPNALSHAKANHLNGDLSQENIHTTIQLISRMSLLDISQKEGNLYISLD